MKFLNSDYRRVLQPEIDSILDPLSEIGPHFKSVSKIIWKIPESKAVYKYSEHKWTVSEVLGHLLDTQIIWAFRILWIGRGENRNLNYADENMWNQNSVYSTLSIENIREKYDKISKSTISILKTIPLHALEFNGMVNEVEFTTNQAIATLIAHEKHHLRIIQEKYMS